MGKKFMTTLSMAAIAAIMIFCANAGEWYVATNGDDVNAGTSWDEPFATIQRAVDGASSNDVINVADGTYTPFASTNLPVTIASVNGPSATFIDGGGTNRCATLGARNQYATVVRGFTFTNGYVEAADGGGTIGGTISNCVYVANVSDSNGGGAGGGRVLSSCFHGNAAPGGSGGAVYNASLWDCIVSNNMARIGGGTYEGTVSNSVIVGNVATNGGGCYSGVLISNFIANNVASEYGGGCHAVSPRKVEYCIISNNVARLGGGGYFNVPTMMRKPVLFCCRVVNNIATSQGGGLFNCNAVNCWIGGNVASGPGGGGMQGGVATNCIIVANASKGVGGGMNSADLINCTVYANQGNRGGGTYQGSAINTIIRGNMGNPEMVGTAISYSCAQGVGTDNGNIEGDPLFVDAANGDFHLQAESPCIDAGYTYENPTPTDYGGTERVKGGRIDMGAYEADMQKTHHSVYVEKPIGGRASSIGESVEDGGAFELNVSGPRPLVGIYTNGALATTAPTLSLADVTEDYVITVRFDTSLLVTFYVDAANGSAANLGYVAESPYASIQDAVDEAISGDVIKVAPGVYDPITVPDSQILIESTAGPAATIIDGKGRYRPATLTSDSLPRLGYSPVVLRGFTLRNGGYIPALIADAHYGGGVLGGTLENCILAGNRTVNGGGAAGAILKNCRIRGNSANSSGGGTWQCSLFACLVENNSARTGYGGGCHGGHAENCLIRNNSAYGGGGTYNGVFVNCTMIGNYASEQAGGTHFSTCRNCIIWGNSAPDSPNVYAGAFAYCCTDVTVDGIGNIAADPFFEADGYHLAADSPCINAGWNAYSSADVDYDGQMRIVGTAIDVGASEYQEQRYAFIDNWGAWSIENDVEFSFPVSLADWDDLARFAWRARDRFVMTSEIGDMPPSDKPILISLGTFSFGGIIEAVDGSPVPSDEEFGVPVWRVRLRENTATGRFHATVGDVEVRNVVIPPYNADKWVESVYGQPPFWHAAAERSGWYARRDRARLELFMTLVPAERYADYTAALAQDEENMAPEDANRLSIRGFRANTSTNDLHYVNVRLPSEAIVNVLGASDLAGTNWTFCGIGSFARGYSSAGIVASNQTYFVTLAEGTGDSDGDGISDVLEVMVYGTDPRKADTSDGGLKDGEKIFRYGLNPFVRDTDGDGYDDDEEIANGQNPTTYTPGADSRTIRYVYDADDKLIGVRFGGGGGRMRTRLSPAGNPTVIEKKGE